MSDLKFPTYGGQAVIEGVMMRGSQAAAVAMRAPDNQIIIHTETLGAIYRSRLARIPFLRGLVILWDALALGMRALTISANTQTGEDEKLEGPALYLTVSISLFVGVGLFFLAPAWAGQLSENWLGVNAWWGNLIEGLIRLFLLVAYIWLVGRIPEISRVFAYHGAEHKTINAFEALRYFFFTYVGCTFRSVVLAIRSLVTLLAICQPDFIVAGVGWTGIRVYSLDSQPHKFPSGAPDH
jgi:uncharacterized protein YqhQ